MHSQQREEAADNQRAPRLKTRFASMQYPVAFKLSMQPAFLSPTNSPKQHHHSLPFPEGGCDPTPRAPAGGNASGAPQGGFAQACADPSCSCGQPPPAGKSHPGEGNPNG